MKSFLVAVVIAVVVAGGSALVLDHLQKTSETAFSTSAVRV